MSYILDALKKAEAERKLGAVPGVHAQPVIIPSTGEPAALWRRPAAWGSLAAVLTVAVLLSWFQPWKPAPAPVATAPASPAPAPVAAAPASPGPAPVAAAPANPAPGRPPAAPTPDRVLAKQQAVPPADPAPVAAGAVAEAPVFTLDPPAAEPVSPKAAPKAARRAGEPKPSKDAAESGPREAKKTGPAPAAPEQRVAALRELPENIQREIPALTINGYIYASNPADRSVLINNRLLREGEQVAPGLTLERMQPREAIMNYRGYRYRLSY